MQPSVPTWNYAVVHAYGTATLIEDKDRVRAVLRELTNVHEAALPQPSWKSMPTRNSSPN